MNLNEYILVFLKDIPMKIPSVKFWALTSLICRVCQIQLNNYHILTPEDCMKELDDLLNHIEYEGGWVRAWWEQHQYLRNLSEKKRWI